MLKPDQNDVSNWVFFFFFFWPHYEECGILVLQPGIEPMPVEVEARCLNYWAAREVPEAAS